jgi:outer membrane murein-binding lipoprotein Lpp
LTVAGGFAKETPSANHIDILKTHRLIIAALFVFSCLLAGCGPKYKPDPVAEPASLEKNFSSADAATKSIVEQTTSNINAAHYEAALDGLQELYSTTGMTTEQTNAILGVKSFIMQKIDQANRARVKPAK